MRQDIRLGRRRRPMIFFDAEPFLIAKGESSTLKWETEDATSVTIGTEKDWYTWDDPPKVELNGSMTVYPEETTTYYLLARNRRYDLNRNSKADGRRRGSWASAMVEVK